MPGMWGKVLIILSLSLMDPLAESEYSVKIKIK